MIRSRLPLLLLPLALAACDLFGPSLTEPTEVFTVAPYEYTELNLTTVFGLEGEGGLAFSVEGTTGSVTGTVDFPNTLVVEPTGTGSGTITVSARTGSDLGDATLQFDVEDPGTLESPPRVTIAEDQSYEADVQSLFRPVPETEYEVRTTSGPVTASVLGTRLLVFPNGVGDATVTVVTTRFTPQRLVIPFTVVPGDDL